MSRIVIELVQDEVFPLLSVTVSTEVFEPTFAQLNVPGDKLRFEIPQISLDKLFTRAGETVTVPSALRKAVTFLHPAIGRMVSLTVTTAEQVAVTPFISVTVRITGLLPVLEQLKLTVFKARLRMPQKSWDPLSTCAVKTVDIPLVFRKVVTFLQSATGTTVSNTVTIELQVDVFPLTSVTVSVTELAPTFEQVNAN